MRTTARRKLTPCTNGHGKGKSKGKGWENGKDQKQKQSTNDKAQDKCRGGSAENLEIHSQYACRQPTLASVAPPTSPSDVTPLPVCTAPHQRRHGQSQSTVSRISSLSLSQYLHLSQVEIYTALGFVQQKRDVKTVTPTLGRTFSLTVKPSHTSARRGLLLRSCKLGTRILAPSVSCKWTLSRWPRYRRPLPATLKENVPPVTSDRREAAHSDKFPYHLKGRRWDKHHGVSVQCTTENGIDFCSAPVLFPLQSCARTENIVAAGTVVDSDTPMNVTTEEPAAVTSPSVPRSFPSPTSPVRADREKTENNV